MRWRKGSAGLGSASWTGKPSAGGTGAVSSRRQRPRCSDFDAMAPSYLEKPRNRPPERPVVRARNEPDVGIRRQVPAPAGARADLSWSQIARRKRTVHPCVAVASCCAWMDCAQFRDYDNPEGRRSAGRHFNTSSTKPRVDPGARLRWTPGRGLFRTTRLLPSGSTSCEAAAVRAVAGATRRILVRQSALRSRSQHRSRLRSPPSACRP